MHPRSEVSVKSWLDGFIKILLVVLLVNLATSLIFHSWQFTEDPLIVNALFNSPISTGSYFLLMIFCFLCLLRDKISGFSLSLKDGLKADLRQIQKDKEEITLIKKEMRDLALHMLDSHLTIIENSKRWSGWSEGRFTEMIEKIEADCKRLQVSESERTKIFKTKRFWDRIDLLLPIRDKIAQDLIKNQEQSRLINEEWNRIVNQKQKLSAHFLEKYIPYTSFDDSVKNELFSSIKKFEEDISI